MLIVLQNVDSPGYTKSLVEPVAGKLLSLFTDDVKSKASLPSSGIDVWVGARASWIRNTTSVVIYMFKMEGGKFDVIKKATGTPPTVTPKTGGYTSNSGKGVVSEVYFNHPGDAEVTSIDNIAFACFHEFLHNKTDIGSAETQTQFLFQGSVFTDLHTQGGGGVAADPRVNKIGVINAQLAVAAMPRKIPQWTGLMS